MKNILSITIFLLLLIGCKKDQKQVYDIAPEFESYVQLFIEEAAKRGKTIDFSDTGLLVEFSDVIDEGASGWCFLGEHHIVIDKSEWNRLTEDEREFLLFHELGHCELDRRHVNDQFGNSVWKSIMRGSPLSNLELKIPVPFYGFRKEYYLDEMFDQNAPAPAWGSQIFDFNDVPQNEKTLLEEKNDVPFLNEVTPFSDGNFEVEVKFDAIPNNAFLTQLRWGNSSNYFYINIYDDYGIYIGAYANSLDQSLFYSFNLSGYNGVPFEKITIRQDEGFTKVFFNDVFIFHFDEFDGPMTQVRFDSKNADNVLVQGFNIRNYKIYQLP